MNRFFLALFCIGLTVVIRQIFSGDVQPFISFPALFVTLISFFKTINSAEKNAKTSQIEPHSEHSRENEIFISVLFGTALSEKTPVNNLAINCSLLHLIAPDAEKKSKLNFAMRLAGDYFPNRIFLFFEIAGNRLQFASGSRKTSRETIENIRNGDTIIDETLVKIYSLIDPRSARNNWNFSSPLEFSITASGKEGLLVPSLLSGTLTGIIACLTTDGNIINDSEKNEISMFSTNIAIMLDNHEKFHSKLEEKSLEAENNLAAKLFSTQLPSSSPALNGWEISHLYFHIPEQGGDFHDFFNLPGNRVLIICGRASGRGINAAIFFMKLKTIISTQTQNFQSPAALLNKVSQILCNESFNDLFASLTALEIRSNERKVILAIAGQSIPMINRSRSGFVELPSIESGIPLGLFNKGMEPYTDSIIQLLPGDGILLYTDGVFELVSEKGERFKTEDIRLLLDRIPEQNANETLMSLTSQLLPTRSSNKPCDDYTLIYAKTE